MTTSSTRDTLGSDSVRLYLNEIGHVDLLTADEEKDLGKKIKAGISAQEKLHQTTESLDFSGRRRLQRTVKDGEKAKDHMGWLTDMIIQLEEHSQKITETITKIDEQVGQQMGEFEKLLVEKPSQDKKSSDPRRVLDVLSGVCNGAIAVLGAPILLAKNLLTSIHFLIAKLENGLTKGDKLIANYPDPVRGLSPNA
jgi:hypothetical protein